MDWGALDLGLLSLSPKAQSYLTFKKLSWVANLSLFLLPNIMNKLVLLTKLKINMPNIKYGFLQNIYIKDVIDNQLGNILFKIQRQTWCDFALEILKR